MGVEVDRRDGGKEEVKGRGKWGDREWDEGGGLCGIDGGIKENGGRVRGWMGGFVCGWVGVWVCVWVCGRLGGLVRG